jgi:hypothetical protein
MEIFKEDIRTEFQLKRVLSALIFFSCMTAQTLEELPSSSQRMKEVLSTVAEKVVYLSASAALGSVSLLACAGAKLAHLISSQTFTKEEYLLFKDLSESGAKHVFSQILNPKKFFQQSFHGK